MDGSQLVTIQRSKCYNNSIDIYIYTGLKKHGKDYGGVKEGVGVIKEGYMEVVTFDLDLEG